MMQCYACKQEVLEPATPKANEWDLEAAEFYHGVVKQYLNDIPRWDALTEEMQNALGLAAAEFKKRFVCAA